MPIHIDNNTVSLQSPFYKRDIDISAGPFSCEVFSRASDDHNFVASHHKTGWGIPFEAAVKIDDDWFEVGVHKQSNELWREKGSKFDVVGAEVISGDYGSVARLVCKLPASFAHQLEVCVDYEISETLPFFRKSVKLRNISKEDILVQNICPDLFYGVRLGTEVHILHDFRKEVQMRDPFYVDYTRCQFPEDIDVTLAPGESIESFNVYHVFTPSDREGQAVWKNRVIRCLAPWSVRSDISMQCFNLQPRSDISGVNQFCGLIDQCKEVGIEAIKMFLDQIWTNIGDYEIRRDLFPAGLADLKRVISYAHEKGLKVGTYTSYSIAWHGSRVREDNKNWECVGDKGQRYDPGAWGNMCFLSGWGDYIQEKYLWLADELGFDTLNIDGPTSIPCHDQTHGHAGIGNYEYRNWLWEKEFFGKLKSRGVSLTVPRGVNYLLMGASAIPGGYTEQDFCHSKGMELITNYRTRIYESRYASPSCATWGFLALGQYHGNSIEADEKRPHVFDHALAGLFGYGHSRFIHGNELHLKAKAKKTIKKWISFYEKYRETLRGDFLHIANPDGHHVDAVLHTNPDAAFPAVAVVFNPIDRRQHVSLCFPLMHAGCEGGETVVVGNRRRVTLDDNCSAVVTLKLKPYEIRVIEFRTP